MSECVRMWQLWGFWLFEADEEHEPINECPKYGEVYDLWPNHVQTIRKCVSHSQAETTMQDRFEGCEDHCVPACLQQHLST